MELKWTSKALSDLARLYDFLVLASKPAAARTVQSTYRKLKNQSIPLSTPYAT